MIQDALSAAQIIEIESRVPMRILPGDTQPQRDYVNSKLLTNLTQPRRLSPFPALVVMGQSLAAGFGSVDYLSPPTSRHWMFIGGANGGTRANSTDTFNAALLASITRLQESTQLNQGQTVLSSALAHFDALCGRTPTGLGPEWLGSVIADSGKPIANFAPGQWPLLRYQEIVARMAQMGGSVETMFWMQGESNNSTNVITRGAYRTALLQIRDAATAASPNLRFLSYQTAGPADGTTVATSSSTLGQWDAFRNDGVEIVAPVYPLPDNASIHINSQGQGILGLYLGRKLFDLYRGNNTRKPLHPTSAVISGGYCTITFAGVEGNLVLDTTNVAPVNSGQTKLGFTLWDGTTPVAIGTPEVVGVNQVRFSVPALGGQATVRYALDARFPHWNQPPMGAGNLRDSSTDTGMWRGISRQLVNWCLHFDLAI